MKTVNIFNYVDSEGYPKVENFDSWILLDSINTTYIELKNNETCTGKLEDYYYGLDDEDDEDIHNRYIDINIDIGCSLSFAFTDIKTFIMEVDDETYKKIKDWN